MAKYKIRGTNILHSEKLYADGSIIELPDEDAKKIMDYLIPVQENKPKTTKNNDKTMKTTTNTSKTTAETNKTTSDTNKTSSEITPEAVEETDKEAK